jgi:hypothetical protein
MKNKREHQLWVTIKTGNDPSDNGSAIGKDEVDTITVTACHLNVSISSHAVSRFLDRIAPFMWCRDMTRATAVCAIRDSVVFGERSDRDPTLLDRLPLDRSRLKPNKGRPVTVFHQSGQPFVCLVTRIPDEARLLVLTVVPLACN